jgi:cell filamentation protein
MSNRYDASETSEGRYQPGSDNQVLINKLGITDSQEMDDVELALLEQLTFTIINEVTEDQRLTISQLCEWHRRWLGNVYHWAGSMRSVNMSKYGFQFAAAMQISRLMDEFDRNYLNKYTPCYQQNNESLVEALAVLHVEFVLIHPFREGNGRLARLIATIMALQAGKPALDFSCLDKNKQQYFSAIQTGSSNYKPMKSLFRQVLQESGKNV